MVFVDWITTYISALGEKKGKQQLIALIAGVSLFFLGLVFYINKKSVSYVDSIRQIQKLSETVALIYAKNERIAAEEARIRKLLTKNENFSIKSYFEQFCREHSIVPEPGWATATNPVEGNSEFEEVILAATFKGQTTKTLVEILNALDKNEIVYLTEVSIKKEHDKITIDLVIATKKIRRVVEE